MEDAMKPVIELQDKIRKLEQDMTTLTGDELNAALSTYNRYTHEFEYKNGYAYESEITGVLRGLGFSKEDFDRHTDTLSGGQKTRLSLGRLLLTNRTSSSWTSRPTIWIWIRSAGLKPF